MKKLSLILLVFVFISCKTSYVRYDSHTGNINTIINKLGNKYNVVSYTVNKDYKFNSEIEPDYYNYFTETEKENNIVVYEYKWKKKGKNILIWCKENDGIIEAFSSVEYKGNIKF